MTRGLAWLARLPDSRFAAVWFTAVVAMVAAVVSWIIGLIVGAIGAERVACECREEGIAIHDPLSASAGYISLVAFHGGLSSSVGLMMADPQLVPANFLDSARVGIPLLRTVGSTATVVTTGTLVGSSRPHGAVAPRGGRPGTATETYREVDAVVTEAFEESATVTDGGGTDRTVADRLDDSRLLGVAIAVSPAYFVVDARVPGGGVSNLTLDGIDAPFLFVAVLLWNRPAAIVAQMRDGVTNVSGITFRFPVYAGVARLLATTGLVGVIVSSSGRTRRRRPGPSSACLWPASLTSPSPPAAASGSRWGRSC